MENVLLLQQEEQNRKKGLIVSIVVHLLLLLICFFPYMSVKQEVQPISGILVALGTPEGGNSDLKSASSEESQADESDQPSENSQSKNKSENNKAQDPQPEATKPKEIKENPKPTVDEKILTEESENPIVKDSDQKAKEQVVDQDMKEADRKKKAAETKAQEEARKAAEAKAEMEAAAKKAKKEYSDLFGSGRGENENAGNQGDPNGDPNEENLKGISSGSGRIGGGLSDRGVVFEPSIRDSSQKTGKVVIKVCVDSHGNVTTAKFTQKGSTTTDKYLVNKAEKAAAKYKFTPSANVEIQCGSIAVDFKVSK